ncbi:MAG: DUF362 domain-containing protein [Candidatus Hodarchaeota archaeon]
MLSQLKSKKTEVAISKGDTPKESLIKGIEKLGGISKFIDDGDQIFIKFNLNLPGGFPTNTNNEVLEELIKTCKEAGASKIYLGSFPVKDIPIKIVSDLLELDDYFKSLGAELAFLDNSNYYDRKDIGIDQLKQIKRNSFTNIKVNGNEYPVPNAILNSNKYIIVNQVNVNPLFKFNLSLLNSYSIIPSKYQEIRNKEEKGIDYISLDQYKKDLISSILDVFTVKKPNLVINDLFYILESAGPFIYSDSNVKKTNLMIMGEEAIAVDIITLKTLNLEVNDNELIKQAQNKISSISNISNIKVLGENLNDIKTNVELCVSKLENVKIQNFSIKSGKFCSGCFKMAYHLLNFMKTYMLKDLKYNPNNSLLVGENPLEPEKINHVILLGDCAIKSTKNYKFRKIIIEKKKDITKGKKRKVSKESKLQKKPKIKEKPNKNILELPGCPPDIFNCLKLILKYYGKKNVPNLNLLIKVNDFWINGKLNEKLKDWEAL